MVTNLQVVETTTSISAALEIIKAVIQDAWGDTRNQMEEYGYGPRVIHTAFAQFLVHNIRNRVSRIDTPGISTQLVPNRRHSANHVKVCIGDNLVLTISTVRNPEETPRRALFRTEYAEGMQSWFDITDQNVFEMMIPAGPGIEYIQILHGPKGHRGQKRCELGFIYVAFPLSSGGYRRRSISLDAYLAELSIGQSVGVEDIKEDDLGVTLRKERQDNAEK